MICLLHKHLSRLFHIGVCGNGHATVMANELQICFLVSIAVGGGIMSRAFRQVVEDGYEFFAKRQLVTLFSAPNYCGEFDNAGGMMSVDESLMCSFQVVHSFTFAH